MQPAHVAASAASADDSKEPPPSLPPIIDFPDHVPQPLPHTLWSRGIRGRPLAPGELLQPGDECLAWWAEDGSYYPAVILQRRTRTPEPQAPPMADLLQLPEQPASADIWFSLFFQGWEDEVVELPARDLRMYASSNAFDSDDDDEAEPYEPAAAEAAAADLTDLVSPWAKHTSGFGDRMLRQMGWAPGEGLGKLGEGRTQAVRPRIIRPGLSLDFVNPRNLAVETRKWQERVQSSKPQKSRKQPAGEQFFGFLNSKLSVHRGSQSAVSSPAVSPAGGRQRALDQLSEAELKQELLRLVQKQRQLDQELHKLQAGVLRNPGMSMFVEQRDQCHQEWLSAQAKQQAVRQQLTTHQRRRSGYSATIDMKKIF